MTPEYLRGLKRQCFRLGLDVSGTAVGNDFGHPPGEERDRQISSLKKWIDNAEILGVPVIRVFAGHVKKDVSPKMAHQLMVSGLEECCDYAGQHGVHLALDNHGGPTSTAAGLLALVNDVQSPWFGVNLDTGNFHTEDVYGDLAKVAAHAIIVQVKVVVSGPNKIKQPANFSRIAKILRDVNYRGYIVLEYEESDEPRTACASHIQQLRRAFALSHVGMPACDAIRGRLPACDIELSMHGRQVTPLVGRGFREMEATAERPRFVASRKTGSVRHSRESM